MKRLMGLSAIVYLVSSFTICTVRAELFELLEADYENNSNETGNNNDFIGEAISGVKQYFGSLTEEDQSNNKTATAIVSQQSDSEPLGLTDEVDMALKHATDTADGLWQQFKKGLLSLMGSFSAGDGDGDGDGDGNGDIDGYNATAMGGATPTQTTRATMTGTTTLPMTTTTEQSSLQQMKPIANQTSAIIEDLTTTTSKPIPFPLRPTTTTTTSTTIAPPTNTTITP